MYITTNIHYLNMAQYNPLEIYNVYRNGKICYYSYNEELYAGCFPKEWAQNHLPGTGPNECNNCSYFGSWNGVFLGYCANCAIDLYEGRRGRGFIQMGKEYDDETALEYPSAFDTYLKDVCMDDIGDTDFCNSAMMFIPEKEDYDTDDDFIDDDDFVVDENGDYDFDSHDNSVDEEEDDDEPVVEYEIDTTPDVKLMAELQADTTTPKIETTENEVEPETEVQDETDNDSYGPYYDPHDDCEEYGFVSYGNRGTYGYYSNFDGGYDSY